LISVGSEVQIFPGPPLSSVKFCRVKAVTNGKKSEKRHIHKKLKEAARRLFRLEYESTGDGARDLGVDL